LTRSLFYRRRVLVPATLPFCVVPAGGGILEQHDQGKEC
jgi:hypothetical protein